MFAKLNPKTVLMGTVYSAAAVVLAFLAGKDATANIAAGINGALAAQISANHPAATLAKAQALLNTGKKGAALTKAARYAKASLLAQPINPAALHVAGYALSESGNPDITKARRLEALAYRTSRRDINVIRWMIADGERRGDLPAILKYYDIGMRLGPEAQDTLFPRLNLAMSVPEFHPMFAPYIKGDATWLPAFLGYVISNSKTSDQVANAIMMAGGLSKTNAAYRPIEGYILNLLTSQGHYGTARQYYLTLGGANPSILGSTAFTQDNVNPLRSAITWQAVNGAAKGGDFAVSPVKNRMLLQSFALSGESGDIATKLLFLKPGNYAFKAARNIGLEGSRAMATAKLSCVALGKNQFIWSGDLLKNSGYDKIAIPSDCPVQSLSIWLNGGEGQNGTEISISDISITPAM
jgi:hypothetical protein